MVQRPHFKILIFLKMNLQDKTRVHGELITGSLTIRDNTINDFINGPTLKWTNSSGFDLFGLLNINGYNVRVDFKGTNYDILTLGTESKDDPFLKIDKKRGVTLYNKTLTNISDIVELSPISASFNIKDKATFKVYGTIESTNETVECDVLGEIAPAGPSSFYSSQLTQDMSYKINASNATNYEAVLKEAQALNNSLTIAQINGTQGLNVTPTTGSFSGPIKGGYSEVGDYVVFNVDMDHFDVYNKADNTIKSSVAITGATFRCSAPIFYNGAYYAIDSTGHIRKKTGEDLTNGTWEDKGAISTDGNEYFGLILINGVIAAFSNDTTRSDYIIAYKSSGEPSSDSFVKACDIEANAQVVPNDCSVFALGNDFIVITSTGESENSGGFFCQVRGDLSRGGRLAFDHVVISQVFPKFYNKDLILHAKIVDNAKSPACYGYAYMSHNGAVSTSATYPIDRTIDTSTLLFTLNNVFYFTTSNSSDWKTATNPNNYDGTLTGPSLDLGSTEYLTVSWTGSSIMSNLGVFKYGNEIAGLYFLVNSGGTVKNYIIPSDNVQSSTVQSRGYEPPMQTLTPSPTVALDGGVDNVQKQTTKRKGDILTLISKYKK